MTLSFANPIFASDSNIFSSQEDEIEQVDINSEIFDPLEKYNRKIYNFNIFVDKYTLKPIAKGYRKITNQYVRNKVSNIIFNINRPFSALNSLLQLDFKNFAGNVSGFVIDSTIGLAGLFKPSKKFGISDRDEDFGQTLAIYKVGAGPYLIIPFLGPSNLRDFTGRIVDSSIENISWDEIVENDPTEIQLGITFTSVISTRERLLDSFDEVQENSIDPYYVVRSIYNQDRTKKINNN